MGITERVCFIFSLMMLQIESFAVIFDYSDYKSLSFIQSNLNFTDFNLHSSDIFISTAKIKVPGR